MQTIYSVFSVNGMNFLTVLQATTMGFTHARVVKAFLRGLFKTKRCLYAIGRPTVT